MAGPFGVGAIWVYTVPQSGNPVRIGLAHEGPQSGSASPFVFDWDSDRNPPSTGGDWRLKRDDGSALLDARSDYDRFSKAESRARRAMNLDRLQDECNLLETDWPPTANKDQIDPGYLVKLIGWAGNSWSQIIGYHYLEEQQSGAPGYEYWWIGHVTNFRAALADRGVVITGAGRANSVAAAEVVIASAISGGQFTPDATHKRKYRSSGNVGRGTAP